MDKHEFQRGVLTITKNFTKGREDVEWSGIALFILQSVVEDWGKYLVQALCAKEQDK